MKNPELFYIMTNCWARKIGKSRKRACEIAKSQKQLAFRYWGDWFVTAQTPTNPEVIYDARDILETRTA